MDRRASSPSPAGSAPEEDDDRRRTRVPASIDRSKGRERPSWPKDEASNRAREGSTVTEGLAMMRRTGLGRDMGRKGMPRP
jgi:hypothetical protein